MSSHTFVAAVVPHGTTRPGFATRALRSRAARWISPLLLLVVWQLASASGLLSPKTLAAPTEILSTAWDLTKSGDLPQALLVSLRRATLGLLLGVAIAVGLGSLAGTSRAGDALVDPPMQMIRTLPLFGLVPLFILWFGIGGSTSASPARLVPASEPSPTAMATPRSSPSVARRSDTSRAWGRSPDFVRSQAVERISVGAASVFAREARWRWRVARRRAEGAG